MADDTQDVSTPPSDIDIASLAAGESGQSDPQTESTDASGQVFPFTFCFRYNGQIWATQEINAPTLEGATITANQLADRINVLLIQRHFPPLCTVTAGAC